jgi:hypothetical protein
MRVRRVFPLVCALVAIGLTVVLPIEAQKSTKQDVPNQIRFSGTLSGKETHGAVGLLFSLYSRQTGGTAVWQETQNVVLDGGGRYTVFLGTSSSLPSSLFTTNEPRWLGVQVLADGEPEQARVMLVSVPYAMKAKDAETLGGLPASAYLRADSVGINSTSASGKRTSATGQAAAPETDLNVNTDGGTVNAIPKFSTGTDLVDSMMFELYIQPAFNAFGQDLHFDEDVVKIGDGTGLAKRLTIDGRMSAKGFDIITSDFSSIHVVNNHPDGIAMELNARDQGPGFTNGLFASAESANGTGGAFIALEPSSPQISGDYAYGVFSQNRNAQGVGTFAWSSYNGAGGDSFPNTLTGPIGIWAATAHSSGIPAVFDQRAATGKILSARSQGSEVLSVASTGNITTSGTVTATSFSGSGASLTGIVASTASALASDPAGCAANNFVIDIAANGSLTCAQPSTANLSDGASLATQAYADAGDTALAAPSYVALAPSAALANERVLTAGNGISITDGGAGSTVTIDNKAAFAQTTFQAGDTLQGNQVTTPADFATTYTVPANTLTVGMVIEIWAAGTQIAAAGGGTTFGYALGLGGSLVTPAVAYTQNASTTNAWTLNVRVVVTNITSNIASLESFGTITSGSGAAGNTQHGLFSLSSTQNVTNTMVIKVRETQNLTGSNNTTMRQLIVKIIK